MKWMITWFIMYSFCKEKPGGSLRPELPEQKQQDPMNGDFTSVKFLEFPG